MAQQSHHNDCINFRSKLLLSFQQLLLALLGCVIQDKSREKFVEAALSTDELCQIELKEMIEAVLFMNNMETQIPEGFAEVLKQKRSKEINVVFCHTAYLCLLEMKIKNLHRILLNKGFTGNKSSGQLVHIYLQFALRHFDSMLKTNIHVCA